METYQALGLEIINNFDNSATTNRFCAYWWKNITSGNFPYGEVGVWGFDACYQPLYGALCEWPTSEK